MAVVKVPFCTTVEIPPQFMLDEDFSEPNGVKSVLFDISRLQIAGKQKSIEVPEIGQVLMYIYYLTGTISYICNAFPIIQSDEAYNTQEQFAAFNNEPENTADVCVDTTASSMLGWVSSAGCLNIDEPVGGSCAFADIPSIESVTVTDFAVANNFTSDLIPVCPDPESCGEEEKRIIKWRGCFVITTS
ncbi:MAG: hypothetical protein WDA65_03565 [Christensenellales bacterium]